MEKDRTFVHLRREAAGREAVWEAMDELFAAGALSVIVGKKINEGGGFSDHEFVVSAVVREGHVNA